MKTGGNAIITALFILIGIGVLMWISNSVILTRSFPSLQDYIASTTAQEPEVASVGTGTASTSEPQASTTGPAALRSVIIHAPKGTIQAFIADTDPTREQGLGDRESLPAGQGMLFVFQSPGSYGFWMKDMEFPLDMVWIDQGQNVLGVTTDIPVDSYPNIILPPSPAQYVLEIHAGEAKKLGIATSTRLDFML